MHQFTNVFFSTEKQKYEFTLFLIWNSVNHYLQMCLITNIFKYMNWKQLSMCMCLFIQTCILPFSIYFMLQYMKQAYCIEFYSEKFLFLSIYLHIHSQYAQMKNLYIVLTQILTEFNGFWSHETPLSSPKTKLIYLLSNKLKNSTNWIELDDKFYDANKCNHKAIYSESFLSILSIQMFA